MTARPITHQQLFEVMACVSVGRSAARVDVRPDADLDDPMTRLGVALNVLLDDLEYRHRQAEANLELLLVERTEAIRRREEFISIAAHELYTPMTSLQLVLQGIRQGILTDPDKLHHVVALAERQCRKLAALVDALLSVGRSHTEGPMTLKREPIDLVALAREVVELFAPDLKRSASQLVLDADPSVVDGHWDRHRIEQVLTNLVGNAIKFGAGKPIRLAITTHGTTARLVVADRGIGIAPERLARIFERFERGVPAEHYGGLGLGLSIVREIVGAHGGSVRVDSSPGEGATFTVELPR